ncbi:TonB-dependent receptor [Mangrovivirga cuniculi]|uniref:TonB-dependent receptor n=1 Tax=Mangrovivirga cuniculi TaxID=2715131 RepID=A0A4D7JJ49_9BACT|nr:TonB-dependent receptor [Mangrovivirga cuniculi]QCK15611.1 TonB-dependent receptor [Mangrovivirga cuniculi]
MKKLNQTLTPNKALYYGLILAFLFAFTENVNAQDLKEITGKVTDFATEEPVIGASVQVQGTTRGTVTETDGSFSIKASIGQTLVISFIGYETIEVEVTTKNNYNIILIEDISTLESVVVVGSRGRPRTVIESPVPIDNIDASELMASGQPNIEKMIAYRVPSYNTSNQTISDATAHFDPSELRNLGPSRTLVLLNGKRKNQSALVYVNDTPGKGEVGVDMKSIPTAAIERVEVLRDGAAAQYGSDAIAGVINVVLKDNTKGSANFTTGISEQGDGFMYDLSINKGFKFSENTTLNLTASYYHQDETNRAGEPGEDPLFGIESDDPDWSDWLEANPDLGMIVGQPEFDKASFYGNFASNYANDKGQFYAFGGYTYRQGKSFALYRAPYWITDDAGLLTPPGETYDGFQPTFETDIDDYTFTIGNKYELGEWRTDLSLTTGGNSVGYTIGNTINVDLLPNSPTSFDAGAYSFGTTIGNLDISRTFDNLEFYFGTEIRREVFEVEAGQPESYEGGGAQSFPGLQPGNALKEDRSNIGVYAGADWDATKNFLVGAAIRYENYSDFGSNVSWKVNARQLFAEGNGAIRASLSTGFRAPSLHQIYLSNVQTLVSGGTVSNQGTFNNVDPVIKALGVPALDAETSFNISAGITYRFSEKFSVSADYYNITIDDRVLFTGEIGFDDDDATTNPVEQILIDNNVTSIKFFVNALDTRTQGVDIIADYTNIIIGDGTLDLILSMNYNKTSIEGSIEAPGVIGEEGYDIFNRKEQSRVTTARPNTKVLFGINYEVGKFGATLNNTYFGEVTWRHFDNGLNGAPLGPGGTPLPTEDAAYDQVFAGKVITDLILDYDIVDRLNVNVTVNNLLDVYPDEIDTKGDFVTDLGGRFRYPWEVNQFGFMGRFYKIGFIYQF